MCVAVCVCCVSCDCRFVTLRVFRERALRSAVLCGHVRGVSVRDCACGVSCVKCVLCVVVCRV